MNLLQGVVNLLIEGFAALVVVGEQFGRRQDFLFGFGELALVEIAGEVDELLRRETAGFLVGYVAFFVSCDEFCAVVPPVADRPAMLQTHRFGLGEMFVSLGHVETIEPHILGAEAFFGTFGGLVVEEDDIGVDARVWRED